MKKKLDSLDVAQKFGGQFEILTNEIGQFGLISYIYIYVCVCMYVCVYVCLHLTYLTNLTPSLPAYTI